MPRANWERLQIETARNLILDIEFQTDDKHKCALLFDDSMYQRCRGKGTELCGLVHDHVDVHGDRHQRGLSAAVYRW